jgi:hypothetical protein
VIARAATATIAAARSGDFLRNAGASPGLLVVGTFVSGSLILG